MPPPWQPTFDVYMTRLAGDEGEDEGPASFVLDMAALEHAPLSSHPLRLQIRVALQSPGRDGLRDATEAEALSLLENGMVEALDQALDGVYVGRWVHDGTTTYVFYLPSAAADAVDELPDILGSTHPYEPEWLTDPDPEWSFYGEFMVPDEYTLASMQNRALLEHILAEGDVLDAPRPVEHLALFPSRDRALAAAERLVDAGFSVADITAPATDEAPWSLPFRRADALDGGRPDAFCEEILDIVLPLDGAYDGWSTPIVRGDL